MAVRIDTRPSAVPRSPDAPLAQHRSDSSVQVSDDAFAPDAVALARENEIGAPPSLGRQQTLGFQTTATQPLIDPQQAVDFIAQYNQQLGITGTDLQAKNANMATDPLSLYTGMPAMFYSNIKGAYAAQTQLFDTPAPTITLDGDPHLGNFGTIRGPDGSCVYGLDDFDKSGQGPAEWDLERMAAATVLAARNANLSPSDQEQLVRDIAKNYFTTLQTYATTGQKPPGYLTADETTGPAKQLIDQQNAIGQANFIAGKTKADANGNLVLSGKTMKEVDPATQAAITTALNSYAQNLSPDAPIALPPQILDIKQKLNSGGSSFELQRYEVLVADANPNNPPRIIELKEILPSAVDDGTGDLTHANAGADVTNQETLSGFANPLAGSTTLNGNSFLVRENSYTRANNDLTTLTNFADLDSVASQCAVALARSDAQSMSAADAATWLSGDTTVATQRLVEFGDAYADQTDANWQVFKTATGN